MNLIAMLMLAADLNGQPLPDVVLLDFTAGYCQPCQQMVPVLQRMEEDNFPVRKIDITENPDTSRQYKVDRIPTLVLLVEGREAQRFVGLTSEDELRQAMNDAARKLDMARRSQGGTATQQQPTAFQEDVVAAAENLPDNKEARPGLRGILDRMKSGLTGSDAGAGAADLERPNFRAQSPDAPLTPAGEQPPVHPSCVRVRLIDGRTFDSGTGTIVHSTAGQSTIVTCAHVFKEVSDNAAIIVDVFKDGQVLKYPAKLLGGDHNSDVAFLSIQNTTQLPTSPLASLLDLKADESVFSLGCNNGDLPTRLNMNVIQVNRFKGPENIVCTEDPIQGRSGGGLFNSAGQLIGVCSGAFRKTKEGLYTGVSPVRALAAQLKLSYLLDEVDPVFKTAQANTQEFAPVESNPFSSDDDIFEQLFEESDTPFTEAPMDVLESAPEFPEIAQRGLPDPFAPAAITTEMKPSGAEDLPMEITVIIDSKDPSKGKRVVVIPKPSPWLLELLTGETMDNSGVASAAFAGGLSATSTRQSTRNVTSPPPTTHEWLPPSR